MADSEGGQELQEHPSEVHAPSAVRDFEKLHKKEERVVLASAVKFNRVFGRDSTEVAEDLVDMENPQDKEKRDVAKEVVLSLARLQGVSLEALVKKLRNEGDTTPEEEIKKAYQLREEEVGRIHHEYGPLGDEASDELQALARRWGGSKKEMLYYGTVDATPLYVRLVAKYVEKFGQGILDETYVGRDGKEATIRDSVRDVLSWIERRIASSNLGMVEFQRTNPQGLENQVWEDSHTAYVHPNGEIANHNAPIAPIEVQAYTYDALNMAAKMFVKESETDAKRWDLLASQLVQRTLDHFWIPDEAYFAMGIDRDEKGNARLIQTLSSNAVLLADSGIFDEVLPAKKEMYMTGIINKIFSDEFLTNVGVRCRAKRYGNLPLKVSEIRSERLSDYHGSEASWIKETYDIARGLHRQGFHRLAQQLEIRIINAVNTAGKQYEFFYVDLDGNVNYHPEKSGLPFSNGRKVLYGDTLPEGMQAWTITAVLASKRMQKWMYDFERNPKAWDAYRSSWQYATEERILAQIQHLKAAKHIADIRRPTETQPFEVAIVKK